MNSVPQCNTTKSEEISGVEISGWKTILHWKLMKRLIQDLFIFNSFSDLEPLQPFIINICSCQSEWPKN